MNDFAQVHGHLSMVASLVVSFQSGSTYFSPGLMETAIFSRARPVFVPEF